jgi:glycine/D-amino acid oxidase-like deaminating enzyme
MDLTSGVSFWLIKNGLMASYASLDQDLTCDVAIIGGGITGALAAYTLAKAGVDVALFDKRNIGWGSTSGTTGLLQYEIDTPLHQLADMVGEEHAVRSYKACLEAIAKLEQLTQEIGKPCGFERKKSIYLASRLRDVDALKQEFAMRKKHGFAVDWLEEQQIVELFSFRRPAAILSHDAAQVDAYCMAYKLIQSAEQQGVQVFARTSIAKIAKAESNPRRFHLQTEKGHQVRARTVVFASGYESQQYLKQQVASLISTYAIAGEPMKDFSGWYERCLIWESARPYFYLRTTTDNRAIIGGEDEDFRDPNRRDRLLRRKTKTLQRKFHQLFPHLKLETAFAWTGTFGETKDGLPYIGETAELPGAYFILGYGGNGIVFSMIGAEIIRDTLLGRRHPAADLFRFDR